MSRALLIAPHADDESLFAAYLAQRYAAHVVCVYDEGRESELAQATGWLGCTCQQLPVQKGTTDAEEVEVFLNGLRDPMGDDPWDVVLMPAVEPGGHEEHNAVGKAGWQAFGDLAIIRYATYAPRGERTMIDGHESFPDQPEHVARKLAALSCYRSQIADPASAPWFYSLLDMREWIA